MNKSKIAQIYANTLMGAAAQSQDAVLADMRLILDVFAKTPGLTPFLGNPVIDKIKKRELVAMAFKSNVSALTFKFLTLIHQKDRYVFLQEIAEHFIELDEERRNIQRATVTSAQPMTTEQLDRIRDSLEKSRPGNKFLVANDVDKSLIAGFRIRQKDKITDASVRYKLSQLRRKLVA